MFKPSTSITSIFLATSLLLAILLSTCSTCTLSTYLIAVSQVVTRSNSSSSTKSTKATSSSTSSPSLSVADFHKTMAEFQSITLLTIQVADLKNESSIFRNNINDLNKRIQALESTSGSHLTSTADIVSTLLHDIAERERFSRNVIIRGIPESTSSILADIISGDTTKITEALETYLPAVPFSLKSIRLGKPSDRGPRSLKIFLSSKEVALKLISDFNIGVRDLPSTRSRSISVVHDRTLWEREFIRSIYTELDNRRKNGVSNIMVKYRDGIPSIVPISSSSQGTRSLYSSDIQSKN
ncbi:hypothetical protein QTP88_011026 [Uroleucon formosanum]